MYIFYSGPGDCYASAGVSSRTGKKTSVNAIYLGRVLDRDKGIYQNKERGVFTFNAATGEFGNVDAAFVAPRQMDGRRKGERISVDFGDVFFMDSFLQASGMMAIVDSIDYENKDTLHAMLLFYILSSLANKDAIHWYEGSVVRLLYPHANLTSQRISSFLAAIGTPEKQMVFQQAYIRYIKEHYAPDCNILVDSTGLPNSIHFSLTEQNVHNGKLSNEVRLIFVVQRSTGLPLYFRAVPGNIVDVSTLSRIFLHLDSMGVDISSCLIDAGYNSGDNLDLFYNEDHTCKIGYITRIGSGDREFKQMVKQALPGIDKQENFIKYGGRYLFMVKKTVMVGSKRNNPAWMYLGLDYARMSDEIHKLLKRAARDSLSDLEVYEALSKGGAFGLLADKEYPCVEILPAYYQRQSAEQIFDIAKNYTKLLPLRTGSEATFNGHLLLSYIATCVVKMIQIQLKSPNVFFVSQLACLRNQKCTIYPNRLVTDVPQREANDTYKAFGMKCPASIPIENDRLQYTPAASLKNKSKKRKKNEAVQTHDASGSSIQAKHGKKLDDATATQQIIVKRGKGRPKGSKNKKTLLREVQDAQAQQAAKRGRGRPKGAKNKKTLLREAQKMVSNQAVKRGRGRPKGSKNKKRKAGLESRI